MLTLRTRRPARTISGLDAHQVNWRAANDPSLDDDPFAAARGMVTGAILGVVAWAVLAGLTWWAVHLLVTGA